MERKKKEKKIVKSRKRQVEQALTIKATLVMRYLARHSCMALLLMLRPFWDVPSPWTCDFIHAYFLVVLFIFIITFQENNHYLFRACYQPRLIEKPLEEAITTPREGKILKNVGNVLLSFFSFFFFFPLKACTRYGIQLEMNFSSFLFFSSKIT